MHQNLRDASIDFSEYTKLDLDDQLYQERIEKLDKLYQEHIKNMNLLFDQRDHSDSDDIYSVCSIDSFRTEEKRHILADDLIGEALSPSDFCYNQVLQEVQSSQLFKSESNSINSSIKENTISGYQKYSQARITGLSNKSNRENTCTPLPGLYSINQDACGQEAKYMKQGSINRRNMTSGYTATRKPLDLQLIEERKLFQRLF
jgi:hypothetical protein